MFQHTSFTLNHQLERAVYEFHDKPALIHYMGYHRRLFTYGDLKTLSHQMAVYLEGLGFIKGDRIAVWASNSPEWVILMLGCSLMGLILVPIDTLAQENFAQSIFERSKASYLFHDRKNSEQKNISWAPRQELISHLLDKLSHQGSCKRNYVVAGSDILQIVYTSGTTSAPKGVKLSHQNILANAYSLRERFVYPEESTFLSILPLSHMFEQIAGCYGPLLYGCKIVYVSHRPLPHMLRISQLEKVTHMVAVPALLELLKRKIEKKIADFSVIKQGLFSLLQNIPYIGPSLLRPFRGSLKMVVCGGAALKPQTQSYFQRLGIDILCGYGMTEASPVIACQSPYQQTPGQVGKALPRQFLRISEEGEILTFGDNISAGYFENDEATKTSFTSDGWLRTGDIGKIDEKGNLTLLGRSKEMILTENGINIFPQDVEAVLESLSPGSLAVVIEDPLQEGRLMAALKNAQSLDLEALKQLANEQLSEAQRLSRLCAWIGDFPRTHTMKIQRNKVRAFFAEQKSDSVLVVDLPKAISVVFALIGKLADDHWPSLHLKKDLGFDSIQIVQLWMRLQNELGIEICSDIFEGDPSLKEWLKRLEAIPKIQKKYLGENCHEWGSSLTRRMIQPIARGLASQYFPCQALNRFPVELLRANRPVMIIANHTSHLDLLCILQALPKQWRFRATVAAARDYFFEKHYGALGRFVNLLIGCIGFSREGDHESNMRLLEKNWSAHHPLILMPEGTRSRSGKLLPLKQGAAWIAMQFHAIILPIQLEGCFELWPPQARLPLQKGPLKLSYQTPIDSENYNDVHALTEAMTRALTPNHQSALKEEALS